MEIQPEFGQLSDLFRYSSTAFYGDLRDSVAQDKVEKYVGDHSWSLPEDGRVQLSFTKSFVEKLKATSPDWEKHLQRVKKFSDSFQAHGGDFTVIEVAVPTNNVAHYRLDNHGPTSAEINASTNLGDFIEGGTFQTPAEEEGRNSGGRWRRYM